MRNIIRKGFTLLMAFVIVIASSPTYVFSQTIIGIESESEDNESEADTTSQEDAAGGEGESVSQEETGGVEIETPSQEETTGEEAETLSQEESTGEETGTGEQEDASGQIAEDTSEQNKESGNETGEETTADEEAVDNIEQDESTTETDSEVQTEETLLQEEELGVELPGLFVLGERSEGWKDLDWLKGYYESIHTGTSTHITDTSITVSDYLELIMLSNVNPSYYYNKDIVLNTSSNTNDFGATTFNLSSEAKVDYNGNEYSFIGLCGDENYPYEGNLSVADMTLMTDVPLFVYLSDKAVCSGTLNFTHKYHTTNNLLAEKVVHSETVNSPSEWNIVVHTDVVEG